MRKRSGKFYTFRLLLYLLNAVDHFRVNSRLISLNRRIYLPGWPAINSGRFCQVAALSGEAGKPRTATPNQCSPGSNSAKRAGRLVRGATRFEFGWGKVSSPRRGPGNKLDTPLRPVG